MSDGKWLEFHGQSLDALIAAERTHRLDSIVAAVDQAVQAKWALHGESTLTPEERLVCRIEQLESQIANGGIGLFFQNTPEYAVDAVHDLQRIGCMRLADLLREALAALAPIEMTSRGVEAAFANLDSSVSEKLDALSDRFWDVYRTHENVADALFAFIKNNRSQFHL